MRTAASLVPVALTFSMQAHSAVVMSAACSEPSGVRYDRIGDKTERSDDRFSGSRPTFILSNDDQLKLTVILPDSISRGPEAKQQAHEATLIDVSESMITALALYDDRINLYTLFPERGIALLSVHKNIPLQGGIPSGALFTMECKFEIAK